MKSREYGKEQPFIKFGVFKIRLPFVHYKIELPEVMQGILMCCVCLGAIEILTEVLGISFEIAWAMVIINAILYNLHSLLGDPVVPGWITPAIPLVVSFLGKYTIGTERIQALIAMQILVGVIFIVMGLTGVAGKLINIIPNSIKAGILLGAGITAIFGELKVDGRFELYPISIAIGGLLTYLILFSDGFATLKTKNKIYASIAKYGMVSAIIVAIIIGPIVGEIPMPKLEVGSLIYIPDIKEVIQEVSPFGVGFPTVKLFVEAISMAFVLYIIAFGDFITGKALIDDAREVRRDEFIEINSNRSNLISGIRNVLMALIAPFIQLCGPLAAAMTATISQRYRDGREQMDSIYGGVATYRWITLIGVSLVPIVSLFQPVLPIALSLTMLVQGYICTKLAMVICKSDTDRGVAGVIGSVLAARGATWGLAIGIILYFLLRDFTVKREETIEIEDIEDIQIA